MRRRLGVLILAAAALAAPPSLAETPKTGYVGAASCAASGCHNGNDPSHAAGSEYGVWSARDPHARAFTVLAEETSRKVMKAYRGGGDAQADQTCLACHSLPAAPGVPAPSRDLLADGVSCEACHGPAGDWLHDHYTPDWRSRPAAAQSKHFFPTRDLARRTELCAGCHVGRPGAAVDHDLIAAGHPRLAFEYTAYHDLLPRHWDRERLPRAGEGAAEADYGGDFLARAWEIGQVAASGQAEALAASRSKPLPDFADLDCYACHHDLRAESWRQKRPAGGQPDLGARSAWYTAVPKMLENGGGLVAAVKSSEDRTRWADALQAAAVQAGRDHETIKPEDIRALLLRLTERDAGNDGPATWDHAMQTYLAVAALSRTPGAPSFRPEAIPSLRKTLKFPPPNGDEQFDSPRDFDPIRFRDALKSIVAAFGG